MAVLTKEGLQKLQDELDDAKAETEQVRKENELMKRNLELKEKENDNQEAQSVKRFKEKKLFESFFFNNIIFHNSDIILIKQSYII